MWTTLLVGSWYFSTLYRPVREIGSKSCRFSKEIVRILNIIRKSSKGKYFCNSLKRRVPIFSITTSLIFLISKTWRFWILFSPCRSVRMNLVKVVLKINQDSVSSLLLSTCQQQTHHRLRDTLLQFAHFFFNGITHNLSFTVGSMVLAARKLDQFLFLIFRHSCL